MRIWNAIVIIIIGDKTSHIKEKYVIDKDIKDLVAHLWQHLTMHFFQLEAL